MVNHFTAAAFIFIATYLVLALGRLPGYRVDRTGIAIIGAAARKDGVVVGFGDYMRVGLPLTLITVALVLAWLICVVP